MSVLGNFFKLKNIILNYELESSIGCAKRFYMPAKKKNVITSIWLIFILFVYLFLY